jgi:hypothetical protein
MTRAIRFTKPTKSIVAGRCAFRCSFPGCDKPTIGPGSRSNQTALTGKVAHIFSASPGGPRGQGGLTEDQLRSAENAIWLCSDHATLIDTNRGEKFPPELLLSYKSLQEARVAREQGGISELAGWFHELVIRESPIFVPDSRIRFGKLTVIAGGNASGKTALCEWITGLGSPSALWRWDHPKEAQPQLRLGVTYFNPEEQHARIEVLEKGKITYYIEDREVPFYPLKVGLVHLRQYFISGLKKDQPRDELELISKILRVPTSTVRNLIPHVNYQNEGCVRNLRFVQDDGVWKLLADHEGEKAAWCFLEMSDSQQAKILIELSVAMARFASEFQPTILMIEGGVLSLDSKTFARYADYLLSSNHHFQTIIMLIQGHPSSTRWSGWEFARLIGEKTSVSIDQSPF